MCEANNCSRSVPATAGSRRRRLWEMPTNCHCPLVGVCLPLAQLRKLIGKLSGAASKADDYDLHVWAVHECATRNPMSDLLQRTLDERFAAVVRQFRTARDADALHDLWREAVARGDVAGAFWAALTHPRCDPLLIESIVRDMHMIQHQAGASVRVDLQRHAELQKQVALLAAELDQVREKGARALDTKVQELARLAGEMQQLRADLAGRDARIDALQRELEALRATLPALPILTERDRLRQRVAALEARERAMADKLAQLRRRAAPEQRAAPAEAAPARAFTAPPPLPDLTDKTVLCVGGRSGNVPSYRAMLERQGARFVHHDGGLEQAAEQLDTGLAAADLVICQTGCISHQAYWRVKDFCKRTGKRCLYVDNPSTSSLSHCLRKAAGSAESGRACRQSLHDAHPETG